MLQRGPAPDRHTYNALLHACGSSGNVQQAAMLMHRMQEAGLSPDTYSYSCLVDACAKDGQLERALQVVVNMDKAGVKPNVVTFSTLLDAVARGGSQQTKDTVLCRLLCILVHLHGERCSLVPDQDLS